MFIQGSDSVFPPPPSSGWGIFSKSYKDPDVPFILDFRVDYSILGEYSINNPSICSKCGAYVDPEANKCPICEPYLGNSRVNYSFSFLASKNNPTIRSKNIAFLIDCSISSERKEMVFDQIISTFSKRELPNCYNLSFGFLSSAISVFQGCGNTIKFSILSNKASGEGYFCPYSKHEPYLKKIPKIASSILNPSFTLQNDIIECLLSASNSYNIDDIVYIFESTLIPKPTGFLPFNLHLVRFGKECDEKTSAFIDENSTSQTIGETFGDRINDIIRRTVSVPFEIIIRCSKGFTLDFHKNRFIDISGSESKIIITVKRFNNDFCLVANVLCNKYYDSQNVFSIQSVLNVKGIAPFVVSSCWKRC